MNGEEGQTPKAFPKQTKAMEWVDFSILRVNDI